MPLIQASRRILKQLAEVIGQLSEDEYARRLPVLSDSSVGMHVRHILEFYDGLLSGIEKGCINYDARVRNPVIESNPRLALEKLFQIMAQIRSRTSVAPPLQLLVSVSPQKQITLETTLSREWAYNLEHAIHHLAIIKIALFQAFPHVQVPNDFGLAFSTLKHQHSTVRT